MKLSFFCCRRVVGVVCNEAVVGVCEKIFMGGFVAGLHVDKKLLIKAGALFYASLFHVEQKACLLLVYKIMPRIKNVRGIV